ncbi:hypothetical protein D9Q98_008476 [Chlorella vulgaris]|uniref:Anaphase-promoting complex subunit 1 n=1 Tax=Chlorella vulgaris TaxID=3077 RepID=A0A9D4TGT0_CHLVU|nr:hypothetical protein D9Q98_008476 [Chlorella vulgaris]
MHRLVGTPALAGAGDSAGVRLLLPSHEVPITFSLLWEQELDPGTNCQPLEGHLATDTNGDLLLCLLSRGTQRLTALRLPPPVTADAAPPAAAKRVEVAFSLPAVAAAAVAATLHCGAGKQGRGQAAVPVRDLLVLQPDGRLSLCAGSRHVCTVSLPSGTSSPAAAYAQLLRPGSAKARDLVNNHSEVSDSGRQPEQTAHMRSSESGEIESEGDVPHASQPSLPRSSLTTSAGRSGTLPDLLPDIRSLADALEPPAAVIGMQNAVGNRVTLLLAGGGSVRVALPFAPKGPLAKSAMEALHEVLPADLWYALYSAWLSTEGSCSGDADKEWRALAHVLLAWAANPSSLSHPAEAGRHPRLPRPSGASSGTSTLPSVAGAAAWDQLLQSEHHRRHCVRFAWASQAQQGEEQAAAQQASPAGAGRAQDDVWRALQALHSVYEDCKMSVLRWQLLSPLGRMLLRLSSLLGARCYADHYCRDLGVPAHPQYTAAPSSPAAAGASPPDMFRALQQLLQGQREGGLAPLLVQQRAGCVQRSADLLATYSLLAEAAASISADRDPEATQAADLLEAAAHRIVRLLVRQGWAQADLDVLPWGVGLPLQQAIQHCRSNPPTDWPQEAYVLIGRDDIAASMAAAQQEQRPAEAAVSSIVSTPLGKMAKASSPSKKPALGRQQRQQGTPAGVTPAALLRLSALGSAATPPLAAAIRQQHGGGSTPEHGRAGGGSPLAAPEGESSRVLAFPELLPVPYTQRLELVVDAPCGAGEASDKGAATVVAPTTGAVTSVGDPATGDGMENLSQRAASLRFGRDLRLLEVRRLLRSSAPVTMRLSNVPEPSDAEGTVAQQLKLTVLAIRTCALPLGRGALTLGTLRPLPTEPLHIPPLCLAGRLPEQNNAVVNLDFSAAAPALGGGAFAEQTAWPEFHNGAAAGLRLAPGTHQLTRTWVVYNKPAEPSYTHAGMLMALGLTGHLSCLAATDLYRYLAQEHDATIIGVLLGMAASKRGSQDSTISKTLFLHLPTRHPSNYPELDISPLVQAAALAGVGLLFQGTCHRVMAEVMLDEIGRRPGSAAKGAEEQQQQQQGSNSGTGLHKGVTQDREGYALAAGLALGLITLGRGRAAVGLADLHLEDKLRYFMVGGSQSGTVGSQQGLAAAGGQVPSPGDGVFGPGVIGFDPTLGEPEVRHGPLPRSTGSARVVNNVAQDLAAAQGSSQVVLEGDLINLGVTSPAAALALGLMYLQTNDAAVAAAFQLPDTHFALDFVQPDHLTLRMLMRSLVMWDSIQPTEEWLLAQLPPLLKGPLFKLMACRGVEAPHADYEALTQAHCCCLAGACLAVGIRFAGSANARAEALLSRYARHFLSAKQRAPEPGVGAPSPTNRDLLEECLGSVLLALSVVMAGSGHLPTFKLLRGLRKRLAAATLSNASQPSPAAAPTTSLNYGSHCTVSMAIGFLFMGAGTLTFGTSLEAVAALVISISPRMPASTVDHRCHLQAFRHLYALAAQPRSVDAIDVHTKQQVYVPIQISLQDPGGTTTPTAAGATRFGSALRPVLSDSKGAADVLADLAAKAAATQPTVFEQEGCTTPSLLAGLDRRGGGVTFNRIAPCLLPEQKQVAAVWVTGPRYWHQLLAAQQGAEGSGCGPSLAALYATRTLFVQRKAGALPYADDPSGVRSLLSRMVHHGGGSGGDGSDDSFDLVNLCSTFGSDPFVMSFAHLFCGGGRSGSSDFCSRLPATAASFRDFCRGALYECITEEKPSALPAYLLLYCIKQGLGQGRAGIDALSLLWGGLPPAVPLRSLALALAYHDSMLGLAGAAAHKAALQRDPGNEAGAQQWQPVISPLLLQACWRQLEQAWARSGAVTSTALRRYVSTGSLAASSDAAASEAGSLAAAGMLGTYLQLHGVPAAVTLQETARQVQEMLRGAQLCDAAAAGTAAAAMVAATHKGMRLPAAQAIAAALLH